MLGRTYQDLPHAKANLLSAGGPWKAVLRRFGYVILDSGGAIVATIGTGGAVTPSQKQAAIAIACLPELLAVLVACEHFFGDRPAKDMEARELHDRLFRILTQAGVPAAKAEE